MSVKGVPFEEYEEIIKNKIVTINGVLVLDLSWEFLYIGENMIEKLFKNGVFYIFSYQYYQKTIHKIVYNKFYFEKLEITEVEFKNEIRLKKLKKLWKEKN